MKKKRLFLAGFLSACLLCSAFSFGTVQKAAFAEGTESAQKLADFSDGFEGYDATGKFIETDSSFADRWTNNVLSGGEEQGIDSHLRGVARIAYEEGESGNKVLHLDNASVDMDSYFHIGPGGDYRVKNFTAGFRLKFKATKQERGWVGISFRKKATAHYVGTNNLLFTVQRYTKNTEISPHCYAVFNGGSTNDFSETAMQNMFGEKLRYTGVNYQVPGALADRDLPWMDYKLVVSGNNYKMYVNDTLMSDCTFDVQSFDYFGYISLNCCTAEVLVDDFYVTVQDTELPPVIEKLPSPELSFDEATKTLAWNKIAGANLYTVYIDGVEAKTANKTKYTLETELAPGDHKLAVKAISEDTFEAYDSDPAEIVYMVKGTSGGEASTPEEENPSDKGCGSSVSACALLSFLLLGGAFLKRKK